MFKRALVALPLAAAGAVWFYWLALPWPIPLRWREPGVTAFMEQRLRAARAAGVEYRIRHTPVPLERISRHLQRAVIVAEDGRFREHRGIDWAALREEFRWTGDTTFSWIDPADLRALAGAFAWYRENRDRVRGRSTITQQVAKNLYFGEDRSIVRKIEEFLVARRMERFLDKDRILEIYLNIAEWGPGIFGAEEAAREYFGVSAANLGPDQAATLAATLPHPLASNPKHRPGRMAWRKALILARMGGTGPVQTVPLDTIDVDIPDLEIPLPDLRLPLPVPADTLLPDSVRRDSIRRDTLRPDTVRR
jgi:monofunctional biosynthetic peptidoglycan transglycosylase